MPHFVLEYSANVIESDNFSILFSECNRILAEMLPTDIDSVRSRAIKCKRFYIGSDNIDKAFIHVTIKVLPGRSEDTLNNLSKEIMNHLRQYFSQTLIKYHTYLSVEVVNLSAHYVRHVQ